MMLNNGDPAKVMCVLAEVPTDAIHRESDCRIEATLRSVRSLRGGGTATDVLRAGAEIYSTPQTLRTIRRDLWLLHRLGLIGVTEVDNTRWWTPITGPLNERATSEDS